MADDQPSLPQAAADASANVVNLQILSPSVGVNTLSFPALAASTTVAQLKQKIRETLPLQPAADQQRLIHRGRLLARDTESLRDIFGEEAVGRQLNTSTKPIANYYGSRFALVTSKPSILSCESSVIMTAAPKPHPGPRPSGTRALLLEPPPNVPTLNLSHILTTITTIIIINILLTERSLPEMLPQRFPINIRSATLLPAYPTQQLHRSCNCTNTKSITCNKSSSSNRPG